MNELLKQISILIIAVSLLSCTEGKPQLLNRSDHGKRYKLQGFSLTQPQGENWMLSSEADDEIVFVTGRKNTLETYIAKATIMRLRERYTNEEFKKFIESKYVWGEKDKRDKRFSVIKEEYSVSDAMNAFCIQYYTKAKDYSPKTPVDGDYFILENEGLICRHPENMNIATAFEFSKRSLSDQIQSDFSYRAQQFIQNIKFEPLFPRTNILTYGLYKKNSDDGKPVQIEGTENEYIQTAEFKHIETTRDIPAKLGTYFGFEFELLDLPPGEEIKFDIYVIHPPLKMNEGAAISTEDSYWLRATVPKGGSYKSAEWFGLTSDADLVPGKWVYKYYIGKEQLLEQEFLVANPDL
jgi:hypothetical protein